MKRGEGFFFVPSSEDINRIIKLVCIPRRGDLVGIPFEVVSKKVVAAGPGFCPFEDRHQVHCVTCRTFIAALFLATDARNLENAKIWMQTRPVIRQF